MSQGTIRLVWFAGVIIWAVGCSVVWFMATREDYRKFNAATACYAAGASVQTADRRCSALKPSDIQVYKAEIDRKARISRLTAGLGAGAAVALWFVLGRPGLRRRQ